MTSQTESLALRAAVANAFLFRCRGIKDLALGYLRDSFKLAAEAAGAPAMAAPPRGGGERFLDWLDAAQALGLETPGHQALREACLEVPADPPSLSPALDLSAVNAESDFAAIAKQIVEAAAQLHIRSELGPIEAMYWFALLMAPLTATARHNLAVLNMDRGNWDLAVRHLEAVLKIDPTTHTALQALHNIAIKANRMAELGPHLETLVRIREKEAPPIDALEATTTPVIDLTPTNGAAVGEMVERRGAAHVRFATNKLACDDLRARAATLFENNPHLLSLRLVDIFPEVTEPSYLLAPGMADALTRIFGQPPAISPTDCFIRQVFPTEESTYIPFHQDVTALATTGVNVWIPLVDCGVDAPSLEIMAERTLKIFPTVTSAGDYNQTEIEVSEVYAAFPPERRFYPTPNLGDAVLFLGSTVHRSHIARGMTKGRMSVEMRFY